MIDTARDRSRLQGAATGPGRAAGRYHHGDLRAAMLANARLLLEEGGAAALSLREIARRVGVSAPSAYHHFASLDAIAVALAEQGFRELAECLEAAPPVAPEAIVATGEAYISFAKANPGLYRLMFGDGFRTASRESEAVRLLRQRALERVQTSLARYLPQAKVAAAAQYLWSVAHGMASLVIDDQLQPTATHEMIQEVLRMAGNGLNWSA